MLAYKHLEASQSITMITDKKSWVFGFQDDAVMITIKGNYDFNLISKTHLVQKFLGKLKYRLRLVHEAILADRGALSKE